MNFILKSTNVISTSSYRTFKKLIIPGLNSGDTFKRKRRTHVINLPREKLITEDHDWVDLWPCAKSFNYSGVPLPLYQGYSKNRNENNFLPPSKEGNRELMKIPNFLHLTPIHVKRHCNLLKRYCTKWPEELNDTAMSHHFPIHITYSDSIHSGPSIRDPSQRKVSLKVEIRHLKLNKRERYKLIKLLGSKKYDAEKDIIFLTSDRCPIKIQNYDYLMYALTAVINESKKFESWELEQEESDWPAYQWEKSQHKDNVEKLLAQCQVEESPEVNEVKSQLKKSVESLYVQENKASDACLDQYKQSVLQLLKVGKALNIDLNK